MNEAAPQQAEGLHVTDHFPHSEQFDTVLMFARRGANTDAQHEFLLTLSRRVKQYGRNAFLSQRQCDYLLSLAKAGGYVEDFDD